MMKRLLILGAMQMHIPIIKRAKERGIYVITCDYIPENEGHKYADEAYFDSTTDFDAVLKLAKKCNVDGIMTFNSDPAALTAAYVADQLNLPSSGYEAVKIMSEKDEFRKFLRSNNFNVPHFGNYTSIEELIGDLDKFNFPVMLKPVDSSGSKGVVRIDRKEDVTTHFEKAMSFSRCKRIIVEEFIEGAGAQMHGDAFVNDGKIEFIYLGDHHFDSKINNLVPISTTFPSLHTAEDLKRVEDEVSRFISKVGYKQGGINIEARISSSNNKVYLIEVGARNGGNFTPKVIEYASNFSFIDAWLDAVLGCDFKVQQTDKKGCYAYMIMHSSTSGILKSIEISDLLCPKILERYDYVNKGGNVASFIGANAAVGVLLVQFNSIDDMEYCVNRCSEMCNILIANSIFN